jgi:uncharacterized protein (DUF1499 family)
MKSMVSFGIGGLVGLFLLSACAGTRPKNLGIYNGRLTICPGSPNCVLSQNSDPGHAIEPLVFRGDPSRAWRILRDVVLGQPRATLVADNGNYLWVEFRSAWWGFVDDAEFYLRPEESCIHLRSAARLGYSDFGVNRNRVEKIRSSFTRALSSSEP